MTANEKWKIEILREINSRNIGELIDQHIMLPCLLLSSVEKNGDLDEEMLCPYCFEKTVLKHKKEDGYQKERVCEHCGKRFNVEWSTTDRNTTAFWKGHRRYYSENIVLTKATINGETGILYISIRSLDVYYNVQKKRVRLSPDIGGFGFAYDGGRYRYISGHPSRARTANYSGYSYPNFNADDSVFEFAKENSISSERSIKDRDGMRVMHDIELRGEKVSLPGRSVLARQAQKFMEENPVRDIPKELFERFSYLMFDKKKHDNITNTNYYRAYCCECGSKFSVKTHGEAHNDYIKFKCEKCGKGEMLFVGQTGHTHQFIVIDTLGDYGIIVRRMNCRYQRVKYDVKLEQSENERVYYNFSKDATWRTLTLSYEGNDIWKVQKSREHTHVRCHKGNLILTEAAKEFLKYSGINEYLEKYLNGKYSCSDYLSYENILDYLQASSNSGFLEKISKIGWFHLCDCYSSEYNRDEKLTFDPCGKTVNEVLKIPKRLVKFIMENYGENPTYANVLRVQAFFKIDKDVMPEDMLWCDERGVKPPELKRIVDFLNISIHQACEYLERVRISQCFLPKAAVIEWYDYLEASKKIEADINDKTVRYPSSLRREHDRAAFKLSLIHI